MIILHLYSDYYPLLGGVENYMRILAESQVAAGHQVRVLCCSRNRQTLIETIGGVTVERVGTPFRIKGTPMGTAYRRALLRQRADLVHLHTPFALGEHAVSSLPPSVPVVATFHCEPPTGDLFLPRLYAWVHRRMLDRVTVVIVTSEALARHTPVLASVESKWRVVPIGIDLSIFRSDGPRAADAAPLLFVGKPRAYKGLDDLLQALARLPEARLDMVGDGPQCSRVREWAQRFGVTERVRFLGELENEALAARMRGAHLLVLPSNSRIETFGIVLVEAMACGIACLTTEVGTGTSWVVQDGVTGRVVPPRRPDLLAAAIGELLADPARLRRMGAAGRERALQLFTREQMTASVERIYRDCLNR
jgi:glycosyltransferase involved in cell wall biosynthesis